MWFTDNGRDWAGDAGPEDELNRVAKGQEGAFYGFPYCHANGIADPDIKKPNACAGVVMPAALTGPHSAGLGLIFYTGEMFPKTYQNVGLIARRGSWNKGQKFGYDVSAGAHDAGRRRRRSSRSRPAFWTRRQHAFHGRPVYLLQMKDGSLLVSDEQNGAIYRVSYDAKMATGPTPAAKKR